MKLSLGALLGSPTNKKKKSRSVSRSGTPSFGSSSSLSSEGSVTHGSQSTPKSVLPSPGCHDFWCSSSASKQHCMAEAEGKITRRELEVVLRRLGPDPPTDEEVEAMLAEADRAGDGSISLEEIGALAGAGPPVEPELWEVFSVFDGDKDGFISAEELLEVFARLGDERCTLEDCRRMIGGVDSNGDGYVCFEDFIRMMDGQR